MKPEAIVEKYLCDRVKHLGGKCFKFSSPSHRGVPDRIVIFPTGQLIFVECKSATGTLSGLQKVTIQELLKLGQNVAVLASKDGVDRLIREAGYE
jgi:hypothetical protein